MSMNYFNNFRKSVTIKIFFSSILSNLVVFGQPMQAMIFDYYSKKDKSIFFEYYSGSNNHIPIIGQENNTENSLYLPQPTSYRGTKKTNVFYAKQTKGTVGKTFISEVDNPYDNFFEINLPDNINLKEYDAVLVYELNGVAGALQTTKSINNFPSYGGKAITVTDQWVEVEENISESYLVPGTNEIFFNRRADENYQYSVRNLRLELKQRSTESITIAEKTLTNFQGYVYMVGTVSSAEIQTVQALGITIPVNQGVFEYIFKDVPTYTKKIDITCVSKGNKLDTTTIPIVYNNDKIGYQFPHSILEDTAMSYSINDSGLNYAAYNGICVNATEGLTDNFGRIIIQGLRFKDIRTLNDDIDNVTGGSYPAYRVKKINFVDSIPIRLHMKYDPSQIPDGYTARDIKTFYFDKNSHGWKALPTDSLDYQNSEIISTAFAGETDYINGVIKVPDSPETGSFAPTTISDMKFSDPATGVVSIAPPGPNSSGIAATSFPLKLPQGRNGMQPSLEVNYNSEGGNGWMGIGWNLSTPAITLNTKWGVPAYNADFETEIYSLNGADLVLKDGVEYTNPHRKANISRTNERIFYQRKEGGYQKIIRHGTNTKNYWWEVIDKQGNKTFYGGITSLDTNAIITDTNGNIAHWAVTRIQDTYNNYIEYTYFSNAYAISSDPTVTAKEFYPEKIKYTKYSGASNYYEIEFKRNDYLLGGGGSASRSDAIVSARNGFLQLTDDLLTEVYVSLVQSGNSQRIRSYRFDYGDMQFKKKQLVKISEYDSSYQLFYTNTLEYYNDQDYTQNGTSIISSTSTSWSGGDDSFSSPLQDLSGDPLGLVPNGSPLGTSVSSGLSFGLRVGLGLDLNILNVGNSLGGSFNYSVNKQETKISLIDINGDGLPDKLFRDDDSGTFYRPNTGTGFGELINLSGGTLGKTKSKTIGAGVDVNVGFNDIAGIGVGKSWSKTKSETDNYFTDFNGDGLPDIIKGGQVYFNKSSENNHQIRKFENTINATENTIESGSVDLGIIPSLGLQTMDELREEHPQFDHVKVWEAPYTGTVKIESNAVLTPFASVPNQENKFRLTIEKGALGQTGFATTLSGSTTELSLTNQSSTIDLNNINVNKGDKLFFRIHNRGYGSGGEVEWNPKITYGSIPVIPFAGNKDDTGKRLDIFDAQQDFIINNDGTELVNKDTITINFNLPSSSTLNPSDDIRFVIKKIRTKLEDSSETVLNTWTRIYNHEDESYESVSSTITNLVNTPAGYKDVFYFYVESDSNVDWGVIKWKPYYTDSNSVIHYPGINYNTFDDNINEEIYWINSSSLIEPVIDNPSDGETQFMKLSHTFFNYSPQLNELADNQFPLQINWVTKGEAGGSIKVIGTKKFYVYRDGNGDYVYTYDKQPYLFVDPNTDNIIYIKKKTIKDIWDAGGKIYSAFYINEKRLAHNNNTIIKLEMHPDITGYSFSPVTLHKPFMVSQPQVYGITYRGWGQFLYNGGLKFNRDNQGNIIDVNENPIDFSANGIELDLFDVQAQQNNAQDLTGNLESDPGDIGNNTIRYTFYDSQNQNSKFINKAIINGTYGYNNGKLTATIGRFGEGNIYELYVDPDSLLTAQPNVFLGMKQRTESKGSAISGNIDGVPVIGAGNGTKSEATTNVLNQYLDINGDRYPDVVTRDKIQFTNMLGALSSVSKDNTDHFLPGDQSSDVNLGITVASMKSNSTEAGYTDISISTVNTSGNSTTPVPVATVTADSNPTMPNINAGVNEGSGKSENSRLWADMNGDGLPDKVRINTTNVDVWLNTGYGFANKIIWGSGYSGLVASSRSNVGTDFSYGKSFAFGFAATTSTADVNTMIVDVNGDGLPDLLKKTGGTYTYYVNTGKNFATDDYLFYDGSRTERDKTIAGNIFGAYTYGIPFSIFGLNFKVVFTGSVGGNASYNEKMNNIQDIDGDGLVDVIAKVNDNNNSAISARLNTIGKTYLLKKVNTPLGGSWSIDYERDGNSYDMPNSKWVLQKITTHDGYTPDNYYKPDVTLTTITYNTPKYDRREREFYGYKTVTIEQRDPSDNAIYRKQVKLFHNENYYLSGAEKSIITYNNNNQKLSESNTLFNLLDPENPTVNMNATEANNYLQTSLTTDAETLLDQSRLFIAVAKVTSTSYENGQGLTAVKEFTNYDTNGNITTYIDRGTAPDDTYRSIIEYYPVIGSLDNATGFPKTMSVFKNAGNNLFRYRTATYNTLGKLSLITTKLNNADDNRVSFGYDVFGNLTTVNELDNLNASANHFIKTIGYDTVLNMYPVTVSNSFGEESHMTYNYLFGVPVLTEDTNHQFMRTRLDYRGRVVEITGPNEMALESIYGEGSAWTIRVAYEWAFIAPEPGVATPYIWQHKVVTKHFDPEYANGTASTSNELCTATIVDGLGQVIQVKKAHPSGNNKWLVSGFDVKDAFGRVIKSYLPVTEPSYPDNPNYLAVDPGSLTDYLTPLAMTYDAKDRVTTVTQPGETVSTTIAYTIEGGMAVQKTTSENTNDILQTMDVYTDVRGRQRKTVQNGEITTKFNYNAINELIEVIDNDGFKTATVYDMAGRKTEMRHPDRGVVTFKYDKASRMTEQSNSNLLLTPGGAQSIKYHYDFSRLIRVEYPQNPTSNIEYTYGAVGDGFAANNNAIGRLVQQKDASGVQAFGYGRMGEVTKNLRSVAVAGFQSYWFLTSWKYDSWNRVQEITYPDQEIVKYDYNLGGELRGINSEIYGITDLQPIVSSIVYNKYGERESLERGNGTLTTYDYDLRRRMNSVTSNFTNFNISNSYTYDALSNITQIATVLPDNSLPASGQIGGPIVHHYDYDNYNRLIHAAGAYTGANDETTPYLKKEYDLVMEYNTDHTIKKKTQAVFQGTAANSGAALENQVPVYKSSYILDYSNYKKGAFVVNNPNAVPGQAGYGYLQPHAPRTIVEKPSWGGAIAPDDPRIRHKELCYDANGNQTEIKEVVGTLTTSLRKNLWDEENRLTAVNLKPDETTDHPIAIYTYDAGGQRIVRYNMDRMDICSNAEEMVQTTTENVMLYPSGLLMGKALHNKEKDDLLMTYTKHYYIGSERISAKTGTSNMGFYPKNDVPGLMSSLDETALQTAAGDALTNETNKVTGVYAKFSQDPPVFTPNGEDGTTSYNHNEQDLTLNIYYFHPDHLGSSAYISNAAGVITQHMEYLPFGETLTDEHSNSFNSPFKYNGKEYDEETGNYYYGARYYDPKWSIFISVDPLAEETGDAYGYCYQNPINLTDPTGMSADPPDDYYHNSDGTIDVIRTNDSFDRHFYQQGSLSSTNSDGNGISSSIYTVSQTNKSGVSPGSTSSMDGYFHPAYDTSIPNPCSPESDWRYSVAIIGVVALPVAIEAFGAQAVGDYLLEEAFETGFESLTGIPFYNDPGDFFQNGIKKGVKKTGGRLGNESTRALNGSIADKLESRGWSILHGGNRNAEEYIPPVGGGRKGGSYPDITATKNGRTLRINTVDTYKSGKITNREAINASRIRKQRPNDRLLTIPKK